MHEMAVDCKRQLWFTVFLSHPTYNFYCMDLPTIGTRVFIAGSLATVKFVGNVDNTKGVWLGVEWDNPNRGKHSGVKDGKQYFECRCGSFGNAKIPRSTPSYIPFQGTQCRIFHSPIGIHLLRGFVLESLEIEIHRNTTWVSISRENFARLVEWRNRG
jgi:hypothetical protein